MDCSGTGDQCNADSTCDPAGVEGNCDTAGATINEGLACDDGLACNEGETCQIGSCTGGTAVDCTGTGDQCNADSTCDTAGAEGNCDTAGATINEGLACDDGLACNEGETCQIGSCTGGTAVDCTGTGDQCNADSTCDTAGAEGNCDTAGATINEGLACDDGLACNEGETCQIGSCTGGAAQDCSGTGDQCNADSTCDSAGIEGNCDTLTPVLNGTVCDDGVPCTDADCQAGACVFLSDTGQVTVNLEVDAMSESVTRDVSFVMTTCGVSVDMRTVSVPFAVTASGVPPGTATVILSNVDADAAWISVSEGHTLRRLGLLAFVSCQATVDMTSLTSSALRSGDFQTAVVVAQDNLVDIVDFSILAGEWNVPITATDSIGADATADGFQGLGDFTAIQVNFLTVGDPVDACAVSAGTTRITRIGSTVLQPAPLLRIPVQAVPTTGGRSADLNADGWVDAADILEFALQQNLLLLPEFEEKLRMMTSPKPAGGRHRWRR